MVTAPHALGPNLGEYDHATRTILIDGSVVRSRRTFTDVLVHEALHAIERDLGFVMDHDQLELIANMIGSVVTR